MCSPSRVLVASVVRGGIAAPSAPIHIAGLGLEDEVWWAGGHVGSSPTHTTPFVGVPTTDRCAQLDPCFVYTLHVSETSATARLRVGLDMPARDDGFEMRVVSPAGAAVSRQNGNSYSMEIFVPEPAIGRWTVTVAPYSADHADFRMRAKLEDLPTGVYAFFCTPHSWMRGTLVVQR